jgi:hypothetical protein
MGFLDWLLGRKKKVLDPAVIFDSDIKKMDVRHGTFLWLLDRQSSKEFCADCRIKKVIIELDERDLLRKVQTKTEKGLVKLPLKEILENLGSKRRYFKFVHFTRPVHVTVFGAVHGDVDLTFSKAKIVKKPKDPVKTKNGKS